MTTITPEQNKLRKAFAKLKRERGSVPVTCTFPNDDVPKFLKLLDEFERQSAKSKIMVRFTPEQEAEQPNQI